MRARNLMMAAAVAAAMSPGLIGAAQAQSGGNPADVQWAQEILKAKGYSLGGRVSNKWTDGAKRALAAFQRANGLPASGELDAATMSKLGAARAAAPTMGTLGGGNSGGPSSSGPARREAPPQPKAVPTARVGAEGGESGVIGGVTLGQAMISGGASADGGPAPTAAPRAAVTGADGAPAGGVLAPEQGFEAANWLRYGAGGVLAATLLAMAAGWWRSGRRRIPAGGAPSFDDAGDRRPVRARVEPSFGGREEGRPGLAPLTAPARPRL